MDLRQQFPRSVRELLGGYVHLGRMVDKSRGSLAGTLGEYIFPCPLDNLFLNFVGITADQFLEAVKNFSDQEMGKWISQVAVPHTRSEIDEWNEKLLSRGPDTEEKWEYFRNIRDAIDPTRTDITAWADLLDLEEKRPVPHHKVVPNSS